MPDPDIVKVNTLRTTENETGSSTAKRRVIGMAEQLSRWCDAANGYLLSLYRACEQLGSAGAVVGREEITLQPRQTIVIKKRYEIRKIAVQRGAVWITSTPAKDDIILEAGDELELSRNWPIVVEALKEAEVVMFSRH